MTASRVVIAVNSEQDNDEYWLRYALALAERAEDKGEVPVGAVIVKNGQVLGEGFNQPITTSDPTAHAEIVAIREASKAISNYRLIDTTLYVTLEPCTMCVGAMIHARIGRVVYGTTEPKAGVVESRAQMLTSEYFNHRLDAKGGVLADECQHQLSTFFARRREEKKMLKQQQKSLTDINEKSE